jgi:hypothetical protein
MLHQGKPCPAVGAAPAIAVAEAAVAAEIAARVRMDLMRGIVGLLEVVYGCDPSLFL